MPKRDIDYSKNVIYKICCKDLNITDIYIGHTSNLVQRRYDHKCKCNKETSKEYNFKIYQFIRANGGWDNWSVILIDKCPCLDYEEACKIERYYIETLKSTLNMVIPSRSKKEWYEVNKEKIAEYKKDWALKNNERLVIKHTEYRMINAEKIKTFKNEKIECECGFIGNRCNMLRHKKSQKHIKLLSGV